MFKLYNQVSALGRFSNGFHTEFIDCIDSMQAFEAKQGYVFTSPDKPDYWMGNGIALFDAPGDNGGEPLEKLWDEYVAPLMPKADKKYVYWESENFIEYKNFDKKYEQGSEVLLKYSPHKQLSHKPKFNVKKLTRADAQQFADIYIEERGEIQRDFIEWTIGNRLNAIEAGNANFFTIWNESRNEIAAIAGLYWCNGIYRYATVNTRKAYRGRGYCSSLIAHVRDYALENGATEIYIVADKDSQAAGIYMNAGFEISAYGHSILADR